MNTTMMHKGMLTAIGLTFAGAMAAGPGMAHDTASTPVGKPVALVQSITSDASTPDRAALIPHGTQGAQSRIDLSDEQKDNAKAIVEATRKNGLDERAAVIAVATSMQESKLENLGHLGSANDHDSLGLFQQRPSSGWGTPDQITDPQYATTAFLNGLKNVSGWHDLPLTVAAQKVQVSAYPDAYAQWESQAADLVAEYWAG
ncbi:hypothetical protein [Plantactinospora sp. KBS50]|uniref:hypothetical protein n=1 Tax=Plantactinospora sp. KBS50 TaxID=2024580 RepID=UPI000BAAB244|nr:hypothetical protein [Plantactinospora sp. KBS50]ASW57707.1 hypothetical protein CIK06_14570 [Plantactinospora sp. KBS50]